ncbi:MAG TPA: universal stress protein [Planctomycetota bacterium]
MLPLRKILVPTDFSPCAAAALDYAAELASKLDAEILLVHVQPSLANYVSFPTAVPLPADWVSSMHTQAQAELAKEAARVKRVKIGTELREGNIHESVLAAATAFAADLIVIGTHGRRGVSHVLLGSVAERVVRHSTVPVLTVRTQKGR